jgi:hypothetical protein
MLKAKLLVAEGLRITEVGRTRMLGELASSGLTDLVAALDNNNRFAAYQLILSGVGGRPGLLGSLWLTLPAGRESEVPGRR